MHQYSSYIKHRSKQTIGRLAAKYPTENQPLNGVLVVKDFQLNIMSPEDLNELGGLITTVITQRQVVPFNAGIGLLKWHLEMMFGTILETELAEGDGAGNQQGTVLRVFDTIDVKKLISGPNQVTLEWMGNAMNDMVADSVLAVILSIDSSPASVKGKFEICFGYDPLLTTFYSCSKLTAMLPQSWICK